MLPPEKGVPGGGRCRDDGDIGEQPAGGGYNEPVRASWVGRGADRLLSVWAGAQPSVTALNPSAPARSL